MMRFAMMLFFIPLGLAQLAPPRRLAWSDEFNRAANTPPNPANWIYDLGAGGWGNHELETYTNSLANAFHDGTGHLVIRALLKDGRYTSARIKTQGRFSFTYGRVDARIKIPYAQGLWPAFWMLGSGFPAVHWPNCGEIDIMENFGAGNHDAAANHGTLHGPGYPGTGITAKYQLPTSRRFADDFHIFSIEWSAGSVEFFVDGNSYQKATPASMPPNSEWVFDNNSFFLILNLAVGGSPAPVGNPAPSTPFPQDMLVDYIRVYERPTGVR